MIFLGLDLFAKVFQDNDQSVQASVIFLGVDLFAKVFQDYDEVVQASVNFLGLGRLQLLW